MRRVLARRRKRLVTVRPHCHQPAVRPWHEEVSIKSEAVMDLVGGIDRIKNSQVFIAPGAEIRTVGFDPPGQIA